MYLSILVGLCMLTFAIGDHRSNRTVAYWLMLAFLFCFSAFRYEVGCDWLGYLNQYNIHQVTSPAEIADKEEPLWVGLFLLQIKLGLDYPWINVISSCVFFVGVHTLARRQPNPLMFLIFLFPVLIVNMPMSAVQQGAAIGVICIAFTAFLDKSLVRYLLWVVVASAIHSSAMIFLLLAPLVDGHYSRQRLLLAALLATPGAFFLMETSGFEVATNRYLGTNSYSYHSSFDVSLASFASYLVSHCGSFRLLYGSIAVRNPCSNPLFSASTLQALAQGVSLRHALFSFCGLDIAFLAFQHLLCSLSNLAPRLSKWILNSP